MVLKEWLFVQLNYTSDSIVTDTNFLRRLVELTHRILKVVVLQEKSRKMGTTLLPEEEALNSRLEALCASLESSSFKVTTSLLLNSKVLATGYLINCMAYYPFLLSTFLRDLYAGLIYCNEA